MNATDFFFRHAGFSYDPKTETPDQGKQRCAQALAAAELRARDGGYSFQWEIDPHTRSDDWKKPDEDGGKYRAPWQTWVCDMYDPQGELVQSLGGIDFGRDGSPFGDPYRRVVEAELALEQCGGN